MTFEQVEDSPWDSIGQNNRDLCNDLRYDLEELDNDQPDETAPQIFTIREDNMEDKENKLSPAADETLYTTFDPNLVSLATSTPLPLLARGHRVSYSLSLSKKCQIVQIIAD